MLELIWHVMLYFSILTAILLATAISIIELCRAMKRIIEKDFLDVAEEIGFRRGIELRSAGFAYTDAIKILNFSNTCETRVMKLYLQGFRKAFNYSAEQARILTRINNSIFAYL